MTGGSGFIGKELVNNLVGCGYKVKVFDINDPVNTNVEWIEGNLLDKGRVGVACQNVDAVFHLASVSNAYKAKAQPTDCIAINCVGTINLLEEMLINRIDRVVLASSVWVYGNTRKCVTETSPVMPCDNIYAYTKALQEYFVIKSGIKYTIFRYGSCYGRNMRKEMVIAKFVENVRKKGVIQIHGDGEQGRCFVHIKDLVDATRKSMSPVAENQIFNVVGSEYITVNNIVNYLQKLFGNFSISHGCGKIECGGTEISIEKAKEVLGWGPKVSFIEGLRDYVEYQQELW